MKKIISMMLVTAMLLCAAVSVSAAGEIYVSDAFDGAEIDPAKWTVKAGNVRIEDGWCVAEGDSAVGLGETSWTNADIKVDVKFAAIDEDAEENKVILQWEEYQIAEGAEYNESIDADNGAAYTVEFNLERREISLNADYSSADVDVTEAFEGAAPGTSRYCFGVYTLPKDYSLDIGGDSPTVCSIGVRLAENYTLVFFDNEMILDLVIPNRMQRSKISGITIASKGVTAGVDNFGVASQDYGLCPDVDYIVEGDDTTMPDLGIEPPVSESESWWYPPVDTYTGTVGTDTVVDQDHIGEGQINATVIVHEETEQEETGRVLTENAETQKVESSVSPATGDTVFFVIAVMLVSFGAAIVVKKVSVE